MATASTLDHLLTNEEDVASCCVEQLGAVAATMLRAVSRPMHTAFTHTGWAQQFWRLQSVRNPQAWHLVGAPAPEGEGAFLGCWFATLLRIMARRACARSAGSAACLAGAGP